MSGKQSASNSNRSRMGYFDYQTMLVRLASKAINAYDMVFTTDTKEWYVISPDLTPVATRSRILIFNSVEEANNSLNNDLATYQGQLVSILFEERYRGYIVNKNEEGFYVIPLCESNIDYDTLGNKPIINIIGTMSEPIVLDLLDSGTYAVKGQYKISSTINTVFISYSNVTAYIERTPIITYVKLISPKDIKTYKISDEEVNEYEVITTDYLKNMKYITEDDLADIIDSKIEQQLEEKIDQKIEEKIKSATSDNIQDMFTEA